MFYQTFQPGGCLLSCSLLILLVKIPYRNLALVSNTKKKKSGSFAKRIDRAQVARCCSERILEEISTSNYNSSLARTSQFQSGATSISNKLRFFSVTLRRICARIHVLYLHSYVNFAPYESLLKRKPFAVYEIRAHKQKKQQTRQPQLTS